jgi:hypothetical protein
VSYLIQLLLYVGFLKHWKQIDDLELSVEILENHKIGAGTGGSKEIDNIMTPPLVLKCGLKTEQMRRSFTINFLT